MTETELFKVLCSTFCISNGLFECTIQSYVKMGSAFEQIGIHKIHQC